MNAMFKSAVATALLGAFGVAGAAEPVAAQGVQVKQASTGSTRDAASGLPTGKRQHKPVAMVTDEDGDTGSDASVKSPRDSASGQASGKRTHAPAVSTGEDEDCDGTADDRVTSSSSATGVSTSSSPPACAQQGKKSPLYDDKGREVSSPLHTGSK